MRNPRPLQLGRFFDSGSNAPIGEFLGRLVLPEMAVEKIGVDLLDALRAKPEMARGANFSKKLFGGCRRAWDWS